MKSTVLHVVYAFFLLMAGCSFAGSSVFYKELNLVGGYSDTDGWVSEHGMGVRNSAGFEYFQKFSGGRGDFMTANLQARLSYDSRLASDEKVSIEVHNAIIEYKVALGQNLRIGHFDPSYGLEPSVDTHGTLFQVLAPLDLGLKKDWGVGYRGLIGPFDAEASLQTGSGMGLERTDGSFLASVRMVVAKFDEIKIGCSSLYGELLMPGQVRTIPVPDYAEGTRRVMRGGLDLQWQLGAYLLNAELSIGENDSADVLGGLLQCDYSPRNLQDTTVTLQGQYWSDDPGNSDSTTARVGLGFSHSLSSACSVRGAVFHDLENRQEEDDSLLIFQVYYFGG